MVGEADADPVAGDTMTGEVGTDTGLLSGVGAVGGEVIVGVSTGDEAGSSLFTGAIKGTVGPDSGTTTEVGVVVVNNGFFTG